MKRTADVIVIGAGAVGIAATYQLAKRKVSVLCLDQFPARHNEGSSHGESRIVRLAVGEHNSLSRYSIRSLKIIHDLKDRLGYLLGPLFLRTGVLIIGGAGGEFHRRKDFFDSTLKAAAEHRVDHRMFSADEMRMVFPLLRVSDEEQGYFEYDGGVLFPEQCVAAQRLLAIELGALVEDYLLALSVEQRGDSVVVSTTEGDFSAERCIIAPGAFIHDFLPQKYHKHFKITRQVVHHFKPRSDPEKFKVGRLPAYIWERKGIYGFPSLDGVQAKVAFGASGLPTDPRNVDRSVSEVEIADMKCVLDSAIPALAGEMFNTATCLYTNTPDGNFVIDRHPDMSNVWIASACSGHGFKHSAAIGELLAELVCPQIFNEDWNLDEFSLGRFT